MILQHCLNLCFTVLYLLHVELLGLHDCLLKTLNQLLALSKSLLMKLALLENQSFEFRGLIDSIWLLHNDIISTLLACLGKVLLESGDLVL